MKLACMHATADGDDDGEQASPLGPREQSCKDTVTMNSDISSISNLL